MSSLCVCVCAPRGRDNKGNVAALEAEWTYGARLDQAGRTMPPPSPCRLVAIDRLDRINRRSGEKRPPYRVAGARIMEDDDRGFDLRPQRTRRRRRRDAVSFLSRRCRVADRTLLFPG
ncbi:hypothetical protein HPB50_016831 [Hyalomma asiaticum]|uniref:Uncharacterized protein n=1 Tax=Hyalomma asiaticum TaxID=266040 RepID=A0ACB7S6W5_HYAAI|nr:hypothetical protein HPB50_016831 [Hyalomma asiaticum]